MQSKVKVFDHFWSFIFVLVEQLMSYGYFLVQSWPNILKNLDI